MADELGTYPPTDLKLQRLRQQGIIPYTADVLAFAAILGLVLALFLSQRMFHEVMLYVGKTFSPAPVGTAAPSQIALELKTQGQEAFSLLLRLLAVFLLPIFGAVVLVGMVQTRFLFLFSAIVPNFSRWFSADISSLFAFAFRLRRAAFRCLKVGLWIAVAFLALRTTMLGVQHGYDYYSAADQLLVASKNVSGSHFAAKQQLFLAGLKWFDREFHRLLVVALVFSFLMGAVSRLLSVVLFRRAHQMTRTELEAEYRESEPPADYKNARSQLMSDDL